MEDGLGERNTSIWSRRCCIVLILVLVEDGLGAFEELGEDHFTWVLILVLVEDGLGGLSGVVQWRHAFQS